MFELTNFALVRSVREAFFFYCVYMLLISIGVIALSRTVEFIFGIEVNAEKNLLISRHIGTIGVLLICAFLAYRILARKKLNNTNFAYLFLAITAVLAFLEGALLGMIPVAYLTTRMPKWEESVPTTPTIIAQDGTETEVRP